jgi:hypothetical protein
MSVEDELLNMAVKMLDKGALQMPEIKKPKLKLVGQDGNAFAIIGMARKVAQKAGWTQEQIEEYTSEATSGDYNHLLRTTMDFFDVS